MRFRINRGERPQGGAPDGGEGGGELDKARQAGQAFLSAGDDAITNAVSGESEITNKRLAQPGGE